VSQAILILAHKNENYVYRLSKFLKQKFNVYVHFDTKFNLSRETKEKFNEANIFVCQKINVHWGAFSIIEATFVLMKEALKNKDNTFFHLISGQDFPTQNINKIYDFYDNNTNIYMWNCLAKTERKSYENVLWWTKYYFYFDKINRRTWYGKIYHRISLLFQMLFNVNKFKNLNIENDIYYGSAWIDIPREPLEYVFSFLDKNPNWYKLFQTSAWSDESLFQTILCNSKYKRNIISDSHRYISWKKKYNNYPAILDISDYDNIKRSNSHFARKIDKNISKELIVKLQKELMI
jgi:hypothetical protein